MQPATVKRWHTTAFRLYWCRKSKGQVGRPAVPREMRDLIRRLSRENPLGSAERIVELALILGLVSSAGICDKREGEEKLG